MESTFDSYIAGIMEEYRALRSESQRCRQIISTTMWAALLAYLATGGLAISYYDDKVAATVLPSDYFVIVLAILGILSTAATVSYLSEFRRYMRVGWYIKKRVEPIAAVALKSTPENSPIAYEHWLTGKHDLISYVVSFLVLQLPHVLVFTYILEHLDFLRFYQEFIQPPTAPLTTADSKIWLLLSLLGANIMLIIFIFCDWLREIRQYRGTNRFVPSHKPAL